MIKQFEENYTFETNGTVIWIMERKLYFHFFVKSQAECNMQGLHDLNVVVVISGNQKSSVVFRWKKQMANCIEGNTTYSSKIANLASITFSQCETRL